MHWSFLSDYTQAVVASLLLIAVFALFPARYGSLARWAIVVLAAALVDQGSKALLLARMAREPSFHYLDTSLLGGWLHLTYFQNDALGFDYAFPFLLLSTLAFVLVLAVLYQRLGRANYRMSTFMEIGLGLMAGGLLGILLDRIRLSYVVDFLEFGPNASYIYNLADLFTMLGGVLALTRFGELATYVRIGLRRRLPPMGVAEPSPPPLRPARQVWRPRLQAVLLCAVAAVALHFMWQVGVVKLPPLHAAAQRGDLKRVQKLLRQGARVNRTDEAGATPLYYAVAFGHVQTAAFLIDHGANVNATSANGASPLNAATSGGFDAMSASGARSLSFATWRGTHEVELTQLLLDHGARVTDTAFQNALVRCAPKVLALLLQHGLDPNAQRWPTPPLVTAATTYGNAETVKLLLQAGAKVDAKNTDGQTALHHAARAGDIETIRVLLAAGANVSAQDGKGATPLLVGAGATITAQRRAQDKVRWARESREVPQLLIAHGADVNTHSREGWTPLAQASLRGDAVWVDVLLKAGAQVNAKGARGWTPLHYAAAKGHAEVVKMLLAAGADPALRNDDGATPAQLAKDEKVKSLLRAR